VIFEFKICLTFFDDFRIVIIILISIEQKDIPLNDILTTYFHEIAWNITYNNIKIALLLPRLCSIHTLG